MEEYLEYARGLIDTGNKIFNACAEYNQQVQALDGSESITSEERSGALELFARVRDAELERLLPGGIPTTEGANVGGME